MSIIKLTRAVCATVLLNLASAGVSHAVVTIDYVLVGDAGNAGDVQS